MGGFEGLKKKGGPFKISSAYGGSQDESMPVAHTCFNTMEVPEYSSKEIFRQRLKWAVHASGGFGFA